MKEYRNVFDNLYVGGHESAKRRSEDFDVIISMGSENKNTDFDFIINDGVHNYNTFKNGVDKTIEYLKSDNKVLVHCSAGLSRSVAVCIATQVCYYEHIGYITAIQNARSNTRMPENELMRSAEQYIKNNSAKTSQIDVREEIERFSEEILDDINKENDNIKKEKMKLIIGKNVDEWTNKTFES